MGVTPTRNALTAELPSARPLSEGVWQAVAITSRPARRPHQNREESLGSLARCRKRKCMV